MKLLLSILIFFFNLVVMAENYKYFGEAYDIDSNKKLYSDNHEEIIENGKHVASKIQYKDANGKVFAEKNIRFVKNASLPDFKLQDSRDGYIEGSELNGNEIKLFFRANAEEKEETKIMSVSKNSVVDGGFDFFVKENWEAIDEGKRISFNMFAPSKLDFFRFAVYKVGDEKYKNRDAMRVKMVIDNAALRLLVKPITILYDKETKRIVYYEGISNINNEKGKSYNVKLYYNHKFN